MLHIPMKISRETLAAGGQLSRISEFGPINSELRSSGAFSFFCETFQFFEVYGKNDK